MGRERTGGFGWKAGTRFVAISPYTDLVKRVAECVLFGILAGCVASGSGVTPSRYAVAQIESGYALLQDVGKVGVADSATMNAGSRVKVRNVTCMRSGSDAAICDYDADRCMDTERDVDGDGWCRRTSRFLRVSEPADPFHIAMIYNGWTLDRPR